MNEHTPGPWEYDAAMVWGGPQGLTSICEILFHEDERADEHGPNARLIAAAPDLLEALEKLAAWILDEDCQYVEMTPNERKQIDKDAYAARAAIACARGES